MSMDAMVKGGRLLVRQSKEWVEILAGFETGNRYAIHSDGAQVGWAAEERGGLMTMMLRAFLRYMRPMSLRVYGQDKQEVARGDKGFSLYFHGMDVSEGGQRLGTVQRKFSVLSRRFEVRDAGGRLLATIVSPLFRIWTFKVMVDGAQVGKISKKWGGGLREIFTDADTFGVEFSEVDLSPAARKLLLFATFLIDFTCFEDNANRKGLLTSD